MHMELKDIAKLINPIIQGWINYYGKYYSSILKTFLANINLPAHWVRRKFKRFRGKITKSIYFLGNIAKVNPKLFAHWFWGVIPTVG